MVSGNIPKLLGLKVEEFEFSVKNFEAKEIRLKAEKSMKCLYSHNKEAKKVLIAFKVNVIADDERDFKLSAIMHVELQTDALPEDDEARNEYVRKNCFPYADKAACEKLSDVLVMLGHNKLDLASEEPFV